MKKLLELTAATVLATGALGVAGLGLSMGTASAVVGPLPEYHWCPGQNFDPGWGDNWDPNVCHDDFHRDNDGNNHDHDYHGNGFRGGPPDNGPPGNYYTPPGYNGPPPPPGGWQPAPFCIPFVTCAPT
jgi:hypothetical protein